MDRPTPIAYTPDLVPDVDSIDIGALTWRTATKSSGQGGNCVEVAFVDGGGVVTRHSKRPAGTLLAYSDLEWAAFLDGVGNGEFNLPRP